MLSVTEVGTYSYHWALISQIKYLARWFESRPRNPPQWLTVSSYCGGTSQWPDVLQVCYGICLEASTITTARLNQNCGFHILHSNWCLLEKTCSASSVCASDIRAFLFPVSLDVVLLHLVLWKCTKCMGRKCWPLPVSSAQFYGMQRAALRLIISKDIYLFISLISCIYWL
jgi:hypothetical protein